MHVDEPGLSYSAALSAELKWQLKQRDTNASALAKRTQIGQRTIGQWLNGRNKIPLSFAYVASLAIGARPGSLFRLAEVRLTSKDPLLVSGKWVTGKPSPLSADELKARGDRFVQCVAAELRMQLSARELSVRQLGLKLGKAPTIAGEWLNGKKALPVHFAYNVCQVINFPIEELIDQAEARIDRYPEDPDEISPLGQSPVLPDEVGRRLRALLAIKQLDDESGYSTVTAPLQAEGYALSPVEWELLVDGDAALPSQVLETLAVALGAPPSFLVDVDGEVTERAEAEAELARVAAEAGVKTIATRGAHLSPESMRDIANLVTRYIQKD